MTKNGSMRSHGTGEELRGRRARELVRGRPFLSMAAAAAVGATFGGVVFSRLGRLVFFAAVGYVANELWHREGRLDLGSLVERMGR
jgi:hypothetical protein